MPARKSDGPQKADAITRPTARRPLFTETGLLTRPAKIKEYSEGLLVSRPTVYVFFKEGLGSLKKGGTRFITPKHHRDFWELKEDGE